MLHEQDQDIDASTPPPLSDHYHQARKQYSLVSGILLAYVLVGIKLPDNGKIIPSAEVALKTPDALPLIFIALLVYFSYRLTIEWNQCSEQRCALLASRIDFYVAHALGILAVAAYLIDRALQVGLGELVVAYAPEAIFVSIWLLLCIQAPLLLRASLEQFSETGTGQGHSRWLDRVDASMAPVFVVLVCLLIIGLNAMFIADSLTDFSNGSWYRFAKNLSFGIMCLGMLCSPRRLRERLVLAPLRNLVVKGRQ